MFKLRCSNPTETLTTHVFPLSFGFFGQKREVAPSSFTSNGTLVGTGPAQRAPWGRGGGTQTRKGQEPISNPVKERPVRAASPVGSLSVNSAGGGLHSFRTTQVASPQLCDLRHLNPAET